MKYVMLLRLTTVIALAGSLTGPIAAQSNSVPAAGYPRWTGASYPIAQHLSVMLLHLDDAALAMARNAQQSAKSETVKKLAADVVAERTHDIDAARSVYAKKFGEAPPAWPRPQNGYGLGMMGGYGPGMMGGGNGNGDRESWYGPMMGYGDAYQMMMGGRANWWGSANADEGFVPALMRLDAMEISMATVGLTSSEADTKNLARKVVSARTDELSRLSKNIK